MNATSPVQPQVPTPRTAVSRTAVIGIDVGGTGVKGAGIDRATGALVTGRHKVATPEGGRPEDVVAVVANMVTGIRAELASRGIRAAAEVGICVPSVVRRGVTLSAGNIDASWIGLDALALFEAAISAPCTLVNDADAAAVAESLLGAARGAQGVTLVLTLGTGLGSGMMVDGVLVPNTELGHIEFDGHAPIEHFISPKVIERDGVTLTEWAARLNRVLVHIERLFSPELIVLGGSISKSADEFLPLAGVQAAVIPAQFRNNAGMIGAALLTSH